MRDFTDNYKAQGLRKQLINQLAKRPELNPDVLAVMGKIPRHWFFDSAFIAHAYEDKAFPIAAGQTISQPYTVAFQTTLLSVEPGQKVLEIGTGSGYQTMVLVELGCKVFTIERQKALYSVSNTILSKYPMRVKQLFGDGFKGWEAYAPYDRILITCGAPEIPAALVNQLKPGGIMVIPVGDGQQEMQRLVKNHQGEVSVTTHGTFRFVPMLANRASKQ